MPTKAIFLNDSHFVQTARTVRLLAKNRNEIFKQPKLTINLDLGDRFSHYFILDEADNMILEQNLPTTLKRIHQVFSKIPRSRIALETGSHSPWSAGS